MGERTHTPGPWTLRRRDGVPHGDSDNLGWDWHGPEENIPPEPMRGLVSKEADARLIAAAPDMFEALKVAREAIWSGGDTVKAIAAIDAALAKASPHV